MTVSIPSRGFWFFEVVDFATRRFFALKFQSPRGDFGFLKLFVLDDTPRIPLMYRFQSPRGDFGFLKVPLSRQTAKSISPSPVSIPSRGFWFFEVDITRCGQWGETVQFQSPRGDFGFLKRQNIHNTKR